jgi:uncharacterized ion transporter superfamily protein YfcC
VHGTPDRLSQPAVQETHMESSAGLQISRKAFTQSLAILLVLMLVAGILTRLVPSGQFQRVLTDGRETIVPGSFEYTPRPDYPVWRWLTAPFEAPFAEGGLTVIIIIVFIVMVGGAFAVLESSGIIRAALASLVSRFGGRKYVLLMLISLFFMILGAFFGIFEEVVPLVPVIVALAYSLGWDALVGLGMSILATNLGFSAAVANPFTIGVAQKLAGLPLFSGAGLRLVIFAVVYGILAAFLAAYARRIERDPTTSMVHELDSDARRKYQLPLGETFSKNPHMGRALAWFLGATGLILLVLLASPLVPAISDLALPLVGLIFLLGGLGAGLLTGAGLREVFAWLGRGILNILPAVPLILMAVSVKHIVVQGGIMDTILFAASRPFAAASPFVATLLIYLLALVIEFFIASGSAKAFLMMPILLPLADLIGVTRQVTVTAYCFGDGFSNLVYPTNPVLLICLGLTVVSYPKWLRWSLGLWAWILVATVAFLGVAVAIGYGPF